MAQNLECLDVLCRWNVWAGTQINEIADSEHACELVISYFPVYELCLELVKAE